MITKKFAQRVVADHLMGIATVTKSGTRYYCEYVGIDGSVIDSSEVYQNPDDLHRICIGTDLNRDPGVYIRRIDKEDPGYHPIVASYHMGTGWYICG